MRPGLRRGGAPRLRRRTTASRRSRHAGADRRRSRPTSSRSTSRAATRGSCRPGCPGLSIRATIRPRRPRWSSGGGCSTTGGCRSNGSALVRVVPPAGAGLHRRPSGVAGRSRASHAAQRDVARERRLPAGPDLVEPAPSFARATGPGAPPRHRSGGDGDGRERRRARRPAVGRAALSAAFRAGLSRDAGGDLPAATWSVPWPPSSAR